MGGEPKMTTNYKKREAGETGNGDEEKIPSLMDEWTNKEGAGDIKKDTEYGSDEYFEELQAQHDEEEAAFNKAGWSALDCSRPFYLHPASSASPEGTKRTVANTETQPPNSGSSFEWFWIEGDVAPPEGVSRDCSVVEVKNGEWVDVKKE